MTPLPSILKQAVGPDWVISPDHDAGNFYSDVVGWTTEEVSGADGSQYTTFNLGDIGMAGDFKSESTVGLIRREIYAIVSLREIEIQQTAVLESKHAPADKLLQIELICARATAARRRRICDRS